MRNKTRSIALLSLVSFWTCLFPAWTMAEVVRVQIDRQGLFADGRHFGQTGSYESLAGRLFFEVDPNAPANARITDLKRAPRNERGKVEFWADFYLLKPVDSGKGNRRLLYVCSVPKRQRAMVVSPFAAVTIIPTVVIGCSIRQATILSCLIPMS